MGFGAIHPEGASEPLFHADWEAGALALTLCTGALGCWTLDETRNARGSLPPTVYSRSSYYEIWIRALEPGRILKQGGDVAKLDARHGKIRDRPDQRGQLGRGHGAAPLRVRRTLPGLSSKATAARPRNCAAAALTPPGFFLIVEPQLLTGLL